MISSRILVALVSLATGCSLAEAAPITLSPSRAAVEAVTASGIISPSPEGNPFAGATFHVEAGYAAKVEESAKAFPLDAERLKKVAKYPTAVWVSSLGDVPNVAATLDASARDEKSGGGAHATVTAFVIYDLPDRDCAAVASSGDLQSAGGGQERYKRDFIDKIATAFKSHDKQRIVALVEPDSLANLATNLALPKCKAAERTYKDSVAYAIKTLAMPNVSIYVDAAHAGWLGWSHNRSNFVRVVSDVLAAAGGPDKIRGFATNVSNYDALTAGDLATLEPSDPATGELAYVNLLDESLSNAGIKGKAFVIDTSRNGKSGIRTRSGSFCNVRGAGMGERPQANPAPLIDAYLWVKPPGESDGGSEPNAAGYDPKCGGPGAPDSAPGAPRAGEWFSAYLVDLAKNATPPL